MCTGSQYLPQLETENERWHGTNRQPLKVGLSNNIVSINKRFNMKQRIPSAVVLSKADCTPAIARHGVAPLCGYLLSLIRQHGKQPYQGRPYLISLISRSARIHVAIREVQRWKRSATFMEISCGTEYLAEICVVQYMGLLVNR
jgi:hypothetical protein